MEKEIKGIIFDLGGVVIEGGEARFTYQKAGRELGVSPDKIQKITSEGNFPLNLGKETSVQFWQRMCEKLSVDCPDNEILKTLWSETYSKLEINEEVIRLIDNLRMKYSVGMLSNTIEEHANINKKRGIFSHFDDVVLSNEVGLRKPQRKIYELSAKRLNIPLGNLAFIDNKEENVGAAENVGMHGILFEGVEKLKVDLKKLGVLD